MAGNIHNFRITISSSQLKDKVILTLSDAHIQVMQRDLMDRYADKHLKVQCIVRPSKRLQTRAVWNGSYSQLSHAMIHQTDPVKDPNDWLTRPDDWVRKSLDQKTKNRRYMVGKKRKK